VFQLEKVVHCDVNISQLQEKHNGQIQKMQAEKDHLSQCIRHIYNKNNPSLNKSCVESTSSKTLLGSSGVGNPDDDDDDDDDDAICRLASEGQLSRKSGSDLTENRMRRCVSLDRIVSQGAFPGRPSLRSSKLGSAAGLDGSTKSSGLRGTRHRSHSMYLDLVQRKGILPRPEVKGRSTSLHSLNRDLSSDAPPDPPPKLKLREPTVFVVRHGAIDDPEGEVQATALRRSSSSQPSVISDLTQLLRCISRRHVAAPAGSHIPVLKRLNTGPPNPRAKHRHGEAKWKSLRDLTEEFDDEYNPVRVVEVVLFCNPRWVKCYITANDQWRCSLILLVFIHFIFLFFWIYRVTSGEWSPSISSCPKSSPRPKATMTTSLKHWRKHRIKTRCVERTFNF